MPENPASPDDDGLPIIFMSAHKHVKRSSVPRLMVFVSGFLLGYPVCYMFPRIDRHDGACAQDDEAIEFGGDSPLNENALAGEPLWILRVQLWGVNSKDDHILCSCSMPEALFPLTRHDGDGTTPVADVVDFGQRMMQERLDYANENSSRKPVWESVEIEVLGPKRFDRVSL